VNTESGALLNFPPDLPPDQLERLDFDPRTDVHTIDDLGLFPDVAGELREPATLNFIGPEHDREAFSGV
jgi:hypothetical protein